MNRSASTITWCQPCGMRLWVRKETGALRCRRVRDSTRLRLSATDENIATSPTSQRWETANLRLTARTVIGDVRKESRVDEWRTAAAEVHWGRGQRGNVDGADQRRVTRQFVSRLNKQQTTHRWVEQTTDNGQATGARLCHSEIAIYCV